jgi:hypothetical protein
LAVIFIKVDEARLVHQRKQLMVSAVDGKIPNLQKKLNL